MSARLPVPFPLRCSTPWLRVVIASILLATGLSVQAQPFDGCRSAPISAAFDDFGKSGRMPPALGRWLNDLDRLVGERPPVEVHLTTHPFATGLMEHRTELARHTVTDLHPLVDRRGLHALLGELQVNAKERLDHERAKAAPK